MGLLAPTEQMKPVFQQAWVHFFKHDVLIVFYGVILFFVEVEAVSLLKHLVDVVGHSVFALLIERQQVGVVIQCRKKFTVVWYAATLDAEPLLCVLQFADKSVVVGELFRIERLILLTVARDCGR